MADLVAYAKMLGDRNKQAEQDADNIFMQRKEIESEIAHMDEEVDKITQNLEVFIYLYYYLYCLYNICLYFYFFYFI